jgi:hypothetical protein
MVTDKKTLIRSEILNKLSSSYFLFLSSIHWKDELYLKGISEGKNKFLSNAYLHLCTGKYSISNYLSLQAKLILNNWEDLYKPGSLVFEHMVPKDKYVQKPCEELAKNQKLNEKIIFELLDKYWFIATITKDEEKSLLSAKVMPEDWNKEDHLARYTKANIEVVKNPIWV